MYPSIHQGSAPGVLHVPSGGHSNSYYPTVSSDAAGPSSNGPSTSGGSPTAQNFPMLRVQVADQYRMMPPVLVSPDLKDIQRAGFTFNFSYERKIEAEAAAAGGSSSSSSSSGRGSSLQVEDPWTSDILKFTEMGFSREEVCMALAAFGADASKDDQFMDFCKHYRELRSMGFPAAVVSGALTQHKNDLSAATEACLAAQQ